MILVGDVGGTKTSLGLFSCRNGHTDLVARRTFASTAYSGLQSMVAEFLPDRTQVRGACFGVAGPVTEGRAEVTNLDWSLASDALAEELELHDVTLINDLVATGYGIAALGHEDFLELNKGQDVAPANAVVIAAGTGLGGCILHWTGQGYVPVAAEPGHADFAPYDDLSAEMCTYLRRQFGFSNVERILSGSGLFNIYSFLRDAGYEKETPSIAKRMQDRDPAAVITEAAAAMECALCSRTLHVFVASYGAEAGNFALRAMAMGGVYLAGGIARKILDSLKSGLFIETFVNKDRLSALLARIPVRVILNENAPLFGAVRYQLQRPNLTQPV